MVAKLSVCIEMVFSELPFGERIHATKRAGLPAFEFWGWSNKDQEAMLRAKQDTGLALACMSAEFQQPLTDPARREGFVTGVRASIAAAHRLGTKTLIVCTGNELPDVPRAAQHDAVVAALRAAAPIAESEGVTLVLEPLNILVDHKGYYLATSAEGFQMVEEVGSPAVKLLFDIYHQQITEGNLIANITKGLPQIGHFHSADVPGRYEYGVGEINYRNLIARIDELGYQGYVGLEYRPSTSSEESLRRVLAALA